MPILTKQFYAHEKGNHDETFYSLARDTDTGRVFVLKQWYRREDVGEKEMTVPEFLEATKNESASHRFLDMIGALATNPYT